MANSDESPVVAQSRRTKHAKRACDQCRSCRARCSGARPCGRCLDYGWQCTDVAVLKKRGRPKKAQSKSSEQGLDSDAEDDIVVGARTRARDATENAMPSPTATGESRETAMDDAWVNIQQTVSSPSVPSPRNDGFNRRRSSHVFHPEQTNLYDAFNPRPASALLGAPQLQEFGPSFVRNDCRYPFLNPALPFLAGSMSVFMACDLLDAVLMDPGVSLFRGATPFIPTRIFRRDSLASPVRPRVTSPALIVALLWCAAHTADIPALQRPGARSTMIRSLQNLTISLLQSRTNELQPKENGLSETRTTQFAAASETCSSHQSTLKEKPDLSSVVDDVLTYTLVAIVFSAGESRSELHQWWSKATQLSYAANLHRLDAYLSSDNWHNVNGSAIWCHDGSQATVEEARRTFYLLFSLDRHLALSSNTSLTIPDIDCNVYVPLPELIWEDSNATDSTFETGRMMGPPLTVSGTSFFEFFLPLMAILGDIITIHRLHYHPRLGAMFDGLHANAIAGAIEDCRRSIERLLLTPDDVPRRHSAESETSSTLRYRREITAAYSLHILDVLAVLLYGKWDPISMLDDADGWITSDRFQRCSTHSISASGTVSRILSLDPELKFMPYLFGIYLLHGSFVLLLFADRMPQLGLNASVEQACETLIRAHEVCAATLNTEYQINFRRVLRFTMYRVRGSDADDFDYQKARNILSLYRWVPGARGLALQSC